jgi:putative transposase
MATVRQHLSTHAITILTHRSNPHFVNPAHAELFIQTLFRYREAGKFRLHAFVAMPDHVHILITPAPDISTPKCIQLIKGGYSNAIRQHILGEVWHSGYHEHRIRDIGDFIAQTRYIAANPARKGLNDCRHVHTNFPEQLDTLPAYFHASC